MEMDTKKITQEPYDKADLDEAVETLRRGGIILYPTDTVWGIGCDATNEEAVRRIYELKRRKDSKSMLVLVAETYEVERLVSEVPEVAYDLMELAVRPITIIYGGDGSGTYVDSDAYIYLIVNSDGTGSYRSRTLSISLSDNGGGFYDNSETDEKTYNKGDGSGNYKTPSASIINNGDGSGLYISDNLRINNNGDGTALVNGVTITDAPKVEKVPPLGKFPPVTSLKPVESCGTVITLEDSILFDFGKSDIRPDAAQTLSTLATVLNNAKVPTAHIYGHTDSVSDEAFNQKLSEDRANAVSAELKKDGVSATLDATGYGETKPVAPNEDPDGSDNPAGRALNRRVEIYIPAF